METLRKWKRKSHNSLVVDSQLDFRRCVVAKSVLEAIQVGQWDFEPENEETDFASTDALPGSKEKLHVLASRIQQGLPLWHPSDRHTYDAKLLAAIGSKIDDE